MLTPGPRSAPRLQRLMTAFTFNTDITKAGTSTTGTKIIFDITAALRDFHRENDKGTKAEKSVLLAALETIIAKCDAWLGIVGKTPKPPDAAKADTVTKLVTDARAERGRLDPSKAEKEEEAEEEVEEEEVPALPRQRGTKLHDRLRWMEAKSKQPDATEAEKDAAPLIAAARKELGNVTRKQAAQMAADAAKEAKQFDVQAKKQRQADKITLGSGAAALSAMLGELFAIFGFVPLAFAGTATQGPVQQMASFATRAKKLLRDLTIRGTNEKHTDFDDVELVVAGSSALGYSPHKRTTFGPQSDVDLGVVSPKLLAACKDAGAELRGVQDRTEPDPLPEIAWVSRALKTLVDRKVTIMVYGSRAAAQRQAGVQIG
jgi:hypothetical protein